MNALLTQETERTIPATIARPPSSSRPPGLRMSYEEYLQWTDEDIHSEWVDGEVIVYMAVKPIHQITLEFLYRLLAAFADYLGLGQVHVAPFEVLLRSGRSSREPDIFFVAQENLHRITQDRVVGPPDLIVEIVSADSLRRDRYDKFIEYRQVGVREYWIIDPRPGKQRADFYCLDEQGEYELFATEENERVESKVVTGFWLRPEWLWQANSLNPLVAFYAVLPAEQRQQFEELLRRGPA
ncbi:MAG: Uma2 family endonuclease [Chloroflexota bacterium]